jgi:hypothetical protein
MAIGLHRVLALPVTLPLPQLVEALNQFQPTYLNVYPSVAMWLADEQQAGRLRLSPQMLVTAAELRTPEMTGRLADAFGVRPFNFYGCTEGLFGSECEHHQGIHLFEDTTLVENVDADGQPVAAGQPGARLLVTNLYNLVQPLLRLEVTDVVTLDPDPCPCGRTLVRVSAIHGRSDDILSQPATAAGPPSTRCTRPAHPRPPGPRVPSPAGRPGPAHPHRPQPRGDSQRRPTGDAAWPGRRPATPQPWRPRPTDHRRAPPTAPPLSRRQAQAGDRRSRFPAGPRQHPLTVHTWLRPHLNSPWRHRRTGTRPPNGARWRRPGRGLHERPQKRDQPSLDAGGILRAERCARHAQMQHIGGDRGGRQPPGQLVGKQDVGELELPWARAPA